MIKGCCCCGFFCSLLFQKRDHPRRELNSIHCQGLIVYIQQLHSGFPAVLLLLLMGGGDVVSPQQKNRTAQKKARQTANALTMGALKSLFASLLLKAICVGVHTLVCDAWHGLSVTKAIQTATGCQIIRLLRRANKCHGSPSELTHGG